MSRRQRYPTFKFLFYLNLVLKHAKYANKFWFKHKIYHTNDTRKIKCVCVWGDQENEFYESAILVAYVFLRELENKESICSGCTNIVSTSSII